MFFMIFRSLKKEWRDHKREEEQGDYHQNVQDREKKTKKTTKKGT